MYRGIDNFQVKQAQTAIEFFSRNAPLITFITGYSLRIIFLCAIVPEIQHIFEGAKIHPFSFFAITLGIPLILEFAFSLSAVINASLFNTRRGWAIAFFLFGVAGLAYNSIELYWFVYDVAGAKAENLVSVHFLLQSSNIAAWFMCEGSGLMIINGGNFNPLQAIKEEKEEINEISEIKKPYRLAKNNPVELSIWQTETAQEERFTIDKITNNLNTYKWRVKKQKGNIDNNLKALERWEFLRATLEALPVGADIFPAGSLNNVI